MAALLGTSFGRLMIFEFDRFGVQERSIAEQKTLHVNKLNVGVFRLLAYVKRLLKSMGNLCGLRVVRFAILDIKLGF